MLLVPLSAEAIFWDCVERLSFGWCWSAEDREKKRAKRTRHERKRQAVVACNLPSGKRKIRSERSQKW